MSCAQGKGSIGSLKGRQCHTNPVSSFDKTDDIPSRFALLRFQKSIYHGAIQEASIKRGAIPELPKLEGKETPRVRKHKTTGQSLGSLIKNWSLIGGCTSQQCGKATVSAIKNSRLRFVKMGGRQGFGTDQECVHKGICCATSSCTTRAGQSTQ